MYTYICIYQIVSTICRHSGSPKRGPRNPTPMPPLRGEPWGEWRVRKEEGERGQGRT